MTEMLSDRHVPADDSADVAANGGALPFEKPAACRVDWPEHAERYLAKLINSPTATVRREGYLHFVGPSATGPDLLLQTSLLSALSAYARWRGRPVALCAEIRQGLHAFLLPGRGSLRTHLPQRAAGQAADQVESWLLCRSLIDLGAMALDGDAICRVILLGAAGPAMAAARHFDRRWPVAFEPAGLRVLPKDSPVADAADVNAVYAFAMLQCHALTGYAVFIEEACAALSASSSDPSGCPIWRAAVAARLWRLTGDRSYIALVALAIESLPTGAEIGDAGVFGALDSLQRDIAEVLDSESLRVVAGLRRQIIASPEEPAADYDDRWIGRCAHSFVLASHSGTLVEGAPFRLYSDCLIRRIERVGDHRIALEIDSFEGGVGTLAAIRLPRRRTPALTLIDDRGEPVEPVEAVPALIRYALPRTRRLSLRWTPAKGPDS
ncbi:MAG: hypothetical protein ACOY5R_22265 [Pseudomonadota bacterium]